MKKLFTCLAILVITIGFSQSNNLNGEVKLEEITIKNIGISIEIDSAEDLETSFKEADLKELLALSKENEEITFRIKCNGKVMSNGVKSHLSYAIEGNTNDKEKFLKGVAKIRKAVVKYYNSKN